MAGEGNDNINLVGDAQNTVFGMGGDDTINFSGGIPIINDLKTSEFSPAGFEYNGGQGYDTISFALGTDTAIDFTKFGDGVFRNIEKLDFTNIDADNVTLNFSDIFAMTDGNNRLDIKLGSGDRLQLKEGVNTNIVSNDSDGNLFDGGQITLTNGGQSVTLFVDTGGDSNAVSVI